MSFRIGKDRLSVLASITDLSHDDDEDDFANIRFERPEKHPGKYTVFASALIGGKPQLRRLECNNPAYGFAKLEEEIEEMLIADAKRARGKKRKDGDG